MYVKYFDIVCFVEERGSDYHLVSNNDNIYHFVCQGESVATIQKADWENNPHIVHLDDCLKPVEAIHKVVPSAMPPRRGVLGVPLRLIQ